MTRLALVLPASVVGVLATTVYADPVAPEPEHIDTGGAGSIAPVIAGGIVVLILVAIGVTLSARERILRRRRATAAFTPDPPDDTILLN